MPVGQASNRELQSKTGDLAGMNHNEFSKRIPAGKAGMRLLGLMAVFLAGCAGCISYQAKVGSTQPISASMEIFVQASVEQHAMESLCLFPFDSPPEAAAAASGLTTSFEARLLQRRPFREVRQAPGEARSDSEALWYARQEGCSLAMRSQLLYIMDGTGAMPTEIVLRTRILDARTGGVLWDIKQHGWSNPGCDVDLVWHTIAGEPAQRCHVVANCLAERFADYLAKPAVSEK
jgi:hypothetical protein